ncbi:hypothetical protein H1R20_g3204, partial [Candolleomyces eurysporus]
MLRSGSYGMCDNLKCEKTQLDVKQCKNCRQVFYCSEDCQREDWVAMHSRDCQDYREGVLPINNTTFRRRCYLAHGLSGMIAGSILFAPTSNPRLVDLQQDPKRVQLFRLDHIPSPWINYGIDDILRSEKPHKVSLAFTAMLGLANSRRDLKLVALYFEDDFEKDENEEEGDDEDEYKDKDEYATSIEELNKPCDTQSTAEGIDCDCEGDVVKIPSYLFCLFRRSVDPSNNKQVYIPFKVTETADLGLLDVAEATSCAPITILCV